MPSHMQDTAVFVYPLHRGDYLLLQYVHLFVQGESAALQLAEYPRASECGTSHHYGIHTVAVETFAHTLLGADVAVSYDGDMHARIVLHLAYQCPVGLALIHLRTGAAVDGKGLYAHVLKTLCQVNDERRAVWEVKARSIPPKASLYRDRGVGDSLHHGLGYLKKQGHVLEHAATSPLAGNLSDRTTEVEVQYIGMCLVNHYPGRLTHGIHVLAVDLYCHGALVLANLQFGKTLVDHAYEGIRTDKLGIHHGRPHLLAQQTETYVSDVLHGSQEYRFVPKVDVSYLHPMLLLSG